MLLITILTVFGVFISCSIVFSGFLRPLLLFFGLFSEVCLEILLAGGSVTGDTSLLLFLVAPSSEAPGEGGTKIEEENKGGKFTAGNGVDEGVGFKMLEDANCRGDTGTGSSLFTSTNEVFGLGI